MSGTRRIVSTVDFEDRPCPSCGGQSRVRLSEGDATRDVFAVLLPGGCRETSAPAQAAALGKKLDRLLDTIGAAGAAVVSETWYSRALCAVDDLRSVERGRRAGTVGPAVGLVHLAPCCDTCQVVLGVRILVGDDGGEVPFSVSPLDLTAVRSAGMEDLSGNVAVFADGRRHLRVANVSGVSGTAGAGQSFRHECRAMFERADDLLGRHDMSFGDVIRTWIFLRHMEADYKTLNEVRREFFLRHAVKLYPASTGIGRAPVSDGRQCLLTLHALCGGVAAGPVRITTLHSPTFNEAHDYGSLFSRGLRIDEGGCVMLHLSGTAAVDEHGRSCGGGSLEAQARYMLRNLEGLVASANAEFADAVRIVSYLKHAADGARFRELIADHGLADLPHVIVEGEICRPELLCESEVLACVAR